MYCILAVGQGSEKSQFVLRLLTVLKQTKRKSSLEHLEHRLLFA
jgi:hypothetical protein